MLILNGLEIRKIVIYRSVIIRHTTRRYNLENIIRRSAKSRFVCLNLIVNSAYKLQRFARIANKTGCRCYGLVTRWRIEGQRKKLVKSRGGWFSTARDPVAKINATIKHREDTEKGKWRVKQRLGKDPLLCPSGTRQTPRHRVTASHPVAITSLVTFFLL